jgi:hypothetical protein
MSAMALPQGVIGQQESKWQAFFVVWQNPKLAEHAAWSPG